MRAVLIVLVLYCSLPIADSSICLRAITEHAYGSPLTSATITKQSRTLFFSENLSLGEAAISHHIDLPEHIEKSILDHELLINKAYEDELGKSGAAKVVSNDRSIRENYPLNVVDTYIFDEETNKLIASVSFFFSTGRLFNTSSEFPHTLLAHQLGLTIETPSPSQPSVEIFRYMIDPSVKGEKRLKTTRFLNQIIKLALTDSSDDTLVVGATQTPALARHWHNSLGLNVTQKIPYILDGKTLTFHVLNASKQEVLETIK